MGAVPKGMGQIALRERRGDVTIFGARWPFPRCLGNTRTAPSAAPSLSSALPDALRKGSNQHSARRLPFRALSEPFLWRSHHLSLAHDTSQATPRQVRRMPARPSVDQREQRTFAVASGLDLLRAIPCFSLGAGGGDGESFRVETRGRVVRRSAAHQNGECWAKVVARTLCGCFFGGEEKHLAAAFARQAWVPRLQNP